MTLFQFPVAIQTQSMTSEGVQIYYPRIRGLANRNAEEHMNHIIANVVHLMQQEQVKQQTGTRLEMIGHYEIKTNERSVLSLTLTNYTYSHPMAHGFTLVKSLTFDVSTGKVYSLPDLFKPGSNDVAVLSLLITQQIKQRNIPLLNGFQAIRPNQDFYLADKALVIYFQLYEITPYYVGFPMFPISIYDLQPIAAEQGPLSTLAADIS